MEEIGRILREARERLGFTLDEVERSIHIRVSRLEALENGEFDSLPSGAQARGFLGNYADFLGLEREEILRQFDENRGRGKASRIFPTPKKKQERSQSFVQVKKPGIFSSDMLIAGLIIVGVIAILIWGGGRVFAALNSEDEFATATAEEVTEGGPTGDAQPTFQPTAVVLSDLIDMATEAPTPTSTLQLGVLSTSSLIIIAEGQAWIQVKVDGEEVYSGRVKQDETLEYADYESLELLTGNGGVIRVVYNNQDIGFLGEIGEVVLKIWTTSGLVTATPTITSTPATSTPTTENTPTSPIVPDSAGG